MKFRDLGAQYEVLKDQIDSGIKEVIESNSFILGKQVTQLEEKLSSYVGRKHCIGVANGTEALTLSLMALDIKEGDAVFTSDFTYFASASCASSVGATPIFVDIDLDTFNICPEALENEIKRVLDEGKLIPKAVIPVDLFGLPANFDEILKIAKKYNMIVLEDAAQGFGGEIRGKKACSFGDISATSFFPAKPLGCYGDGGAIFTDDDEIDERLRSLRALGKSPTDKYDNREIGMNSRLDTIQAAILLPKFKVFVDYELESVNKVAKMYNERLKDKYKTPTVPDGYLSSWAQYTILFDDEEKRNEMQKTLKENDIPSMIYYPRGMHSQAAYSEFNLTDDRYQKTIYATKHVLSLPMHPYLKEDAIDKVTNILLK